MKLPRLLLARRRSRAAEPEPPLPPATGEQVEDGILIATAAVRLAVKNRLILRALRDGTDYDEDQLADDVREELVALAREKDDDAARASAARQAARRRKGTASSQHDYRKGDVAILARREQVSRGLALRLRGLVADPAFVASVLAQARAAALDELSRSVRDRAASVNSTAMVDEGYPEERVERMRLVGADLDALSRPASRRPRA